MSKRKQRQFNMTLATTEGTSLWQTKSDFLGTVQEAKDFCKKAVSEGKNSASAYLCGTCFFLFQRSAGIVIDR